MKAAATDPASAEMAEKTEAASTKPPETAEKAEAADETKNTDEPQEIVYRD